MGDFVHLHLHTEYSLLDGANRIKELIPYVKSLGMDACAITDHGVMYGVLDFYKECKKHDIKPILGCEVYVAPRSRLDKQPGVDNEQGHFVLLARNWEGYKNLMKLVSAGFVDGFYYRPRIDRELLSRHAEGLIALTACMGGEIPRIILKGDYERARDLALYYQGLFGEGHFYLELQMNGIPEQTLVNQGLVRIHQETGIPLVATNDAHFLRKEDKRAHDILVCIQTGKTIHSEDRMVFDADTVYVMSPEEMQSQFREFPEALANTVRIAEMCQVDFEFGKTHLPEFYVPEDEDHFTYFRRICYDGLQKRYPVITEVMTERLDYELNVIHRMGYVDYYLIVWDFIRYAKEKEIMVGPGRGSGAGSLAAYCLEITNIEPLRYGLLFERFLNPERISMPDFDIDFCIERREEVIQYVVEKYGADHVAHVITFGTMAARAAIRDVGRALDMSYADVDSVAKLVPMQLGMTLEKALETSSDLKLRYDDEPPVKELIDMARRLEGMPRHASTHAAGVVVTREPITDYVPLARNDDYIVTQFSKYLLEDMGLLKIDFLGLRTLTVMRDAVTFIRQNHGVEIDIDRLDMDDAEVYKLISDGKTLGVFQLESPGMTRFMTDLQPGNLEDIIAGISLYRPGPMESIPKYVKSKRNPMEVTYHHPLLEPILDVTYGCMVYQEQVMEIVRELAGYSLGRADLIRRAMSAKKPHVMELERKNFIHGITDDAGNVIVDGAVRRGVTAQTANVIFDEMTSFAGYAFNKSHAAGYAVIAYQTAWLKKYYFTEYMAANLNSFMGVNEKVAEFAGELKSAGISVLPPDVNASGVRFTCGKDHVRFGLAAVKNVGENAVRAIIAEREAGGPFKSFRDFAERMDGREVNKRCVESLIRSGAFDSFGVYRSQLIDRYERLLDSVSSRRKQQASGQMSFFEIVPAMAEEVNDDFADLEEFPKGGLLSMEKEMLGIYVSGHPLDEVQARLKNLINITSADVRKGDDEEEGMEMMPSAVSDGMQVAAGGIVTAVRTKTTRSNNLMAFVTIEDLYGSMELLIFPAVLKKYGRFLTDESMILVKGKLSLREDDTPKILADDISLISLALEEHSAETPQSRTAKSSPDSFIAVADLPDTRINQAEGLTLRLDPAVIDKRAWQSLLSLLKYFEGVTPVTFVHASSGEKLTRAPILSVRLCESLINELISRLGESSVITGV